MNGFHFYFFLNAFSLGVRYLFTENEPLTGLRERQILFLTFYFVPELGDRTQALCILDKFPSLRYIPTQSKRRMFKADQYLS